MSLLEPPVGDGDRVLGPAAAPITLVEYGDFQCPYCREAEPVLEELLAEYGDGIRFVFRNFPLEDAHPQALPAAEPAELASRYDRFWEAHDLLFEYQDELSPELYARICESLGLPLREFDAAVRNGFDRDRIEADLESGPRSGVNGTPTFFVNGARVDGGIRAVPQALAFAAE